MASKNTAGKRQAAGKKKTQLRDLPKRKQQLTGEQEKEVKGGSVSECGIKYAN